MTSAVLACVHAERRLKNNKRTRRGQETTGQDAQGERGGGSPRPKKIEEKKPHAPPEGAQQRAIRLRGSG